VSEIEAAAYELRRLLAALIGTREPPPGVVRPMLGGVVVTAALVGVEVARHLR